MTPNIKRLIASHLVETGERLELRIGPKLCDQRNVHELHWEACVYDSDNDMVFKDPLTDSQNLHVVGDSPESVLAALEPMCKY